ncbi:MAG: ribonuclease III [Treponema sp.]|jgi:ribonuclease-3|nr:ribonuclease III [Treponema sp.]
MMDRFLHAVPYLPEVDSRRKKELAAFQKTADIRFKSVQLLNLSFMHRSVANESHFKLNNERLEFLGDSILGAVTATLLYDRFPEKTEGELAKIKSVVVSEDILSGLALELQIDNLLLLGRGEELSGGRRKKALLADAMEALIGALYLDSGYKASFSFVSRYISREIDGVVEHKRPEDYKTLLQELCQHKFRSYPQYKLIKQTGPEHDRLFWIEVSVNNVPYGPGTGKNKKSAEQEAAKAAYHQLNSI